MLDLWLPKPYSTQLRKRGRNSSSDGQLPFNSQPKKRLGPHTPASPFLFKDSDIYDSNFHSLYSANEVSVFDFEPIFTDPLTSQSLSDETHSNALNILISAEGENLMYIPVNFENDVCRKALIDNRACANAMPANFYEKLKTQCPNSISELQQASLLNVKVASGRTVKY